LQSELLLHRRLQYPANRVDDDDSFCLTSLLISVMMSEQTELLLLETFMSKYCRHRVRFLETQTINYVILINERVAK